MKVLFIGSGNPPSTFIQRRLDFLSDEGIECLIHTEHSLKNNNILWQIIKLFLSKPTRIYFFLKIISLQRATSFKLKLKRAIKYVDFIKEKPDVIHFHWIDYVYTFDWLIKYFNVPVVSSVRGSMVTIYPNNNPEYKKKLQASFGLTDYVQCVSDSLKNICIEKFNVPNEKVFTNYNGIDVSKFKPKELPNNDPSSFTLITVGSLMWRKGVLLQLLVMNELKDYPIKLICIGKGEDEFKLKYQLKILGLTENVTIVGEKDEAAIVDYLQNANVYISTSIAEGLSNSVLEAASVGLPVIAFDCEGMAEVILNQKTGVILPYGDVKSMAEQILLFYNNKTMLTEFSENAREHIVKNFRIEEHVKSMIQFYQQLLP